MWLSLMHGRNLGERIANKGHLVYMILRLSYVRYWCQYMYVTESLRRGLRIDICRFLWNYDDGNIKWSSFYGRLYRKTLACKHQTAVLGFPAQRKRMLSHISPSNKNCRPRSFTSSFIARFVSGESSRSLFSLFDKIEWRWPSQGRGLGFMDIWVLGWDEVYPDLVL